MVDWLSWWKRFLALFSTKYADSVALARSVALHKKGAYREAYAILQDVLGRHPDLRQGDVYVICAAYELWLHDDLFKIQELLETGLRLGCDDMATYYALSGYVFWRADERERGIREMEKAVDLDPSIYNLTMLGCALSFDGDMRAADIWKRVLEEEPLNCEAHIYLGMLAAKTGNSEEALLMAKKAEELQPSARDLSRIAKLYAEAGEIHIALDKYAEAARLGDAPSGPVYAEIADCHFKLGNMRESCKYLEEGRRCFPNSVSVKEAWELHKDKCVRRQGEETR